jgi:tetratricopeptide (TPR) repeat protein
LDPELARAHFDLWVALEAQGKHPELEQAAREVLRRKPDHADAHLRLGRALAAQGRHAEARAAWQRARELSGSSAGG